MIKFISTVFFVLFSSNLLANGLCQPAALIWLSDDDFQHFEELGYDVYDPEVYPKEGDYVLGAETIRDNGRISVTCTKTIYVGITRVDENSRIYWERVKEVTKKATWIKGFGNMTAACSDAEDKAFASFPKCSQ